MLDLDAKPAAADAVLSLVKLREVHGDLTREYGNFPDKPSREFLDKAAAFQAAASAAGTEISSIDERLEIQSRINFWQSARINAGQRPQTVLLAAFDREAAKRAAGNKAPYKGLAPFQKDDAKNFSGRYEIVGLLVKKVLTHRLLALVGQSGSGKSSAVRAGLIPQLADGAYDGVDDGDLTDSRTWIFPTPIVPGADPLGALEAIYGEIATPDDLPKALDRLGAPVLLSIDQFEEVFTLSEPGDRRNRFIDALLAAASAGVHRHMVVLTMRSDYQDRVKAHPTFFTAFEAGVSTIQTMQASDLRKAIEEPAARLGVGFEPGLVDKLQTSVLGEPAGLPLLSFTLLKLWEMRGDGPMKTADYEALGGDPRVILTKSADKVVGDLLHEDQLVVKEIFTRLVKINDKLDATSNRIKRAALEADLGRGDSLDRVLGILVANNLIRLSPTGAITPTTEIEVAHEALIRNWDKLAEWVREGLSKETSRRVFAVLAETWAGRASITDKKGDLLSGLALQQAEKFEDKTPTEIAFILASKAQERRSELRRKWVTALILVLAIGLAILSWTQFSNSNSERALQGREDAYDSAEALVDRGEIEIAKKVLINALRNTAGLPPWIEEKLDWLRDRAGLPPWIGERIAALQGKPELPANFVALLQAAELNKPKEYVLRLVSEAEWQAAAAKSRAGKGPTPANALGASIAPNGTLLISLWSDGSARIWKRDIRGSLWNTQPITLTVPGRIITAVGLDRNGVPVSASIAAADRQMAARADDAGEDFIPVRIEIDRWLREPPKAVSDDPQSFSRMPFISFMSSEVTTIKFSLTTNEMVLGTKSGEVWLADDRGSVIEHWQASYSRINSAVFSEQGDLLLIADADGIVQVSSLEVPTHADEFQLRRTEASSARFTTSGVRFAVGSTDGIIRIYQTRDRTKLFELSGHRKAVTGIAISNDNARLVSSSADGTIRFWELGIDAGRLVRTIYVNDAKGAPIAVNSVSLSLNGTDTVAAFADGSVRALDSNGRLVNRFVFGPKDTAIDLATLSPDRSALLAAYLSGDVLDDKPARFELLDTQRGKVRASFDIPRAEEVFDWQISASGEQLVYTREHIKEGKRRKFSEIEYQIVTRAMKPGAEEVMLSPSSELPPLLVAISPDGKFVIAGDDFGILTKFFTDGKTPALRLPTKDGFAIGYEVVSAFSPTETAMFAVSGEDRSRILIYDTESRKILRSIAASGDVAALQFSPDGKKLFIGTDLGTGALYDIASEKFTRLAGSHDSGITNVAFSPKNGLLITGSTDSSARIWNAATGQLRHVLRGHRAAVTHATFAPDGKRVLTESEDRSVRLWDTVTGRELTAVRGPDKSTSSWGWFTPDGKGVQTISRYGDVFATRILDRSALPRIRTWNMNPTAYDYDKLQGEACQGSGALSVDDIERTGLPMKPKRLNCPVKSTAQ